ncbi:MAG: 50S ribosomal protein L2 [Kiritimatiellia bacterium]|nr:50S ribosomal protein L2 [Kiritimatiellia bacterium]
MTLKFYKPTTPSQRFRSVVAADEITKVKPEKRLLISGKSKAGRNVAGRITVRHRGGGGKRHYRLIDFKRDKFNITARVAAIEYDPGRSAQIALLHYTDGEKRYILAPLGLKVGLKVLSGDSAEPAIGNMLLLGKIPLGLTIHNIELEPGKGGQLVRGAGMGAILMAREGNYAHVKMPSGEIRMINIKCRATIGQVGNLEHETVIYGKAGASRWRGIRPTVRGRAMNPVDHPHGGGEGKATGGHPRSPWGQYAKGAKTRNVRSRSSRFILSRRK